MHKTYYLMALRSSDSNSTNSNNSQHATRNIAFTTKHSSLSTQSTVLSTQHLTLNTVITPYEPEWTKAVYHLYIIRTQKRDELQKYLSENGIGTGLHYPIPLHLQNAYKNSSSANGDYPITEKVSNEILSLPMFPNLTTEQIEYVSQKIVGFLNPWTFILLPFYSAMLHALCEFLKSRCSQI